MKCDFFTTSSAEITSSPTIVDFSWSENSLVAKERGDDNRVFTRERAGGAKNGSESELQVTTERSDNAHPPLISFPLVRGTGFKKFGVPGSVFL